MTFTSLSIAFHCLHDEKQDRVISWPVISLVLLETSTLLDPAVISVVTFVK